jgi:cytochrome c
MKKTLLILSCITLALASCGSPDSSKSSETASADTESAASGNAATGSAGAEMPGKQLIAKSDCLGCHNETQKIVGPSYVSVAEKYNENDLDYLAGKIIDGGSGVWGEVPMTPHQNLSKEDATEMAKYILSLNK